MSTESLEVQLARLDERNKMILMNMESSQRDSKEAREHLKEAFESIRSIDSRLERLKGSFATTQPTINEFRSVKQKIVGARDIRTLGMGSFNWYPGITLYNA